MQEGGAPPHRTRSRCGPSTWAALGERAGRSHPLPEDLPALPWGACVGCSGQRGAAAAPSSPLPALPGRWRVPARAGTGWGAAGRAGTVCSEEQGERRFCTSSCH